jgi:hypothetical protein
MVDYLDGDGGVYVVVLVEDGVIADDDDVGLDILRHALGRRRMNFQPHRPSTRRHTPQRHPSPSIVSRACSNCPLPDAPPATASNSKRDTSDHEHTEPGHNRDGF